MPLLFIVERVLAIKERGVLATGKLADPERCRFRIGDPVEIRRQDGSIIRTVVSGIPMGMMAVGMVETVLRDVGDADVQPGDEIWVVRPAPDKPERQG
jgi:translation elongation factor EF-Tu-like GTPase